MYARSGRGSGGRGVGAPELPGPLPAAAPRATRFPPEPTPTCRRPGSSAVRSVTKPKQTATRTPRTRAERPRRHAAGQGGRPQPLDSGKPAVPPRRITPPSLRPASPSRRRTRAHLRWTRARSEAKPSEGACPPKNGRDEARSRTKDSTGAASERPWAATASALPGTVTLGTRVPATPSRSGDSERRQNAVTSLAVVHE